MTNYQIKKIFMQNRFKKAYRLGRYFWLTHLVSLSIFKDAKVTAVNHLSFVTFFANLSESSFIRLR